MTLSMTTTPIYDNFGETGDNKLEERISRQ